MFNLFQKIILKMVIFLFLFFPIFSFAAEINFSEIVADPKGTDTNREWVEIKNTAEYSVNLEKYKFCDSGSCHKLYSNDKNFKIPGKSFGIIARNIDEFKKDYPDFNSFILRASFSLTNKGEKLEMKNGNGQVVSVVEYNGEICGKNGDSCSLFGDVWKNGKSTPGEGNIFKEKSNPDSGSASSNSSDEVKINRTYVEISDVIDGKKKLRAEIVDDIPTLMAGAENEFHGVAYGITGIEIRGAEYFWSMGDGKKEYGKNVRHTYLYPGKYVLSLIVKSANFTGNTRKIVEVINPPIEISAVDVDKNWVKLKNNYSDILKLDGWKIFVDGDIFEIPKETYILAKSELIFPNKITNLDIRKDSHIFLLFPNGDKQSIFVKKDEKKIEAVKNEVKPEIKKEEKLTDKILTKVREIKKKIFKKKEEVVVGNEWNSSEQNSTQNKISDFEKRNFLVQPEIEVEKRERNFAEQNFPQSEKIQDLKIQSNQNFILDNWYFIIFISFTALITGTSFFLNYFEKKNILDDEIKKEAYEFEIEEVKD